MILIGRGALLSRAARFAKASRTAVDLVCCPHGDPTCVPLKSIGIRVLETNDPNTELPSMLDACSDGVAFSINNKHIIHDELLCSGVSFFNIHSGLVQQYRGIPEICIFAALCKGDQHYGVTLHRILPRQRVDSGPVISQQQFAITPADGFSTVLANSLHACQSVFESNVLQTIANNLITSDIKTCLESYSYRDVTRLCREAQSDCLSRASDFGIYATAFPRLKSMVDSFFTRI